MITVCETQAFIRSTGFWSEDERAEFVAWVAGNPDAGDLIVGGGGLRKVRWRRKGMGKSGGARIITYYVSTEGEVWLLIGYTKAKFDNLSTEFLVQLRKEIDDGRS